MKNKDIIFEIFNYLGVNYFSRLLNKSKDICLMYHGVVPDNYPIESWLLVKESQFINQLKYLKSFWEIVSLDSYLKGRFISSRPKAIITFDDGYRNNYNVAFPILQELNIPAMIYIVTDFIDSNNLFWFDKIIFPIQYHKLTKVGLIDQSFTFDQYHFNGNGTDRWKGIEGLLDDIKLLKSREIEKIANLIFEHFEIDGNYLDLLMPLSSDQLSEMLKSGLIEIGSHTAHHEILTNLEISEVENTISRSIESLSQMIGLRPIHFSYPNGNYSHSIISILKKYNVSSAVTTIDDFINMPKLNEHEIPRKPVGAFDSMGTFKAQVSGFKNYFGTIFF